jgi:hypothetical protein
MSRVSEIDLILATQDRRNIVYFFSSFLSVVLHSLIIGSLSVDLEFAKFSFDNSRDTSRASCKHSMMGSMYFLAAIGVFFLEVLHSTKV